MTRPLFCYKFSFVLVMERSQLKKKTRDIYGWGFQSCFFLFLSFLIKLFFFSCLVVLVTGSFFSSFLLLLFLVTPPKKKKNLDSLFGVFRDVPDFI